MAVFLIVFLLYAMLNNNSGGGLKQLLFDLDVDTVKPLLTLFGVDEKVLDALSGEGLQNLSDGNGDILSLIKTLLPIISAVYSAYKSNGNSGSGNLDNGGFGGEYSGGGFAGDRRNGFGGCNPQYAESGLSPVKDLLSPENFADLEECLQNNG